MLEVHARGAQKALEVCRANRGENRIPGGIACSDFTDGVAISALYFAHRSHTEYLKFPRNTVSSLGASGKLTEYIGIIIVKTIRCTPDVFSDLQEGLQDYIRTLQVLMDHAPHHTFEEIESVFVDDFGKPTSELFKEIDRTPLAAASLAQ
eukprot:6926790-Pyramimonas_sp.AAC.1